MTLHDVSRIRGISRRRFMVGVGGMTFAFASRSPLAGVYAATPAGERSTRMSPWVSIASDGVVTILANAVEMGQGTVTALPLVLAEELDADWSLVRVEPAPPDDLLYANPAFGMMYTAGSTGVRANYDNMRRFGAQVRQVLLDNVARKWQVPVGELDTEPGIVMHRPSGRRTSYGEISTYAVLPSRAPAIEPSQLKPASRFRLIGRDVMRVELPSKVTGSAIYSIDVQTPGMVYGAVLRSPVEGATPISVDATAARAVPGVLEVVELPYGVAVVAERPFAAFKAKNALQVVWSRTGRAWNFSTDEASGAFAAAARTGPGKVWFSTGSAAAGLDRSTTVVEAEYLTDFAYHAQMEPLNAVASVSRDGGSVEVWCGSQGQTMAVAAVAKAAGVREDQVVYHGTLLGGGFGRRGPRDEDFVVDAVLLSKATKRPIKVIWQREDDVHNGRFRPMTAHHIRAGVDARGRIVAWHHRTATEDVTAFQDPIRYTKAGEKDFIGMGGGQLAPYLVADQLVEEVVVSTGVRTSALRGIGFGPNKFASESMFDEVARRVGMDPLTFRLGMLEGLPRAAAVVRRVAELSDWQSTVPGRGKGLSFIEYDGTQVGCVAEVSVDRQTGDIRVHRFWAVIDVGLAVQPDNVKAQTQGTIVYGLGLALTERITIDKGRVDQANLNTYLVPRMRDVPELHVEVMVTDNPPTGAGQMATPLVAPAIANAVAAATGARIRQIPMLPERVLAAIAASH
jgi:isoquinoline 1-oxidoreductase beta subunit